MSERASGRAGWRARGIFHPERDKNGTNSRTTDAVRGRSNLWPTVGIWQKERPNIDRSKLETGHGSRAPWTSGDRRDE